MQTVVECVEARLAAGPIELPLLPDAASRVIAAARAPEPDPRRIADLIWRDPAFTGHVLAMANSAAFAQHGRLTSLPQALTRLGVRTIGEIALAVSCRTRLFCAKGFEREVREVFRHSLATALFAQEIARRRRLGVESAFVGGLMHDVGKPLLYDLIASLAREIGDERESIDGLVQSRHAELGAIVVEKWGLGAAAVESVRRHHESGVPESIAVVQLADALAHSVGDADPLATLAQHPARLGVSLYDQELGEIVAQREKIMETVKAMA